VACACPSSAHIALHHGKHVQAVHTLPVHVQAVHTLPVHVQAVHTLPVHVQAVHTFAHVQAVHTLPVHVQAVHTLLCTMASMLVFHTILDVWHPTHYIQALWHSPRTESTWILPSHCHRSSEARWAFEPSEPAEFGELEAFVILLAQVISMAQLRMLA